MLIDLDSCILQSNPTKDETLKTTVRDLYCLFLCISGFLKLQKKFQFFIFSQKAFLRQTKYKSSK